MNLFCKNGKELLGELAIRNLDINNDRYRSVLCALLDDISNGIKREEERYINHQNDIKIFFVLQTIVYALVIKIGTVPTSIIPFEVYWHTGMSLYLIPLSYFLVATGYLKKTNVCFIKNTLSQYQSSNLNFDIRNHVSYSIEDLRFKTIASYDEYTVAFHTNKTKTKFFYSGIFVFLMHTLIPFIKYFLIEK